MRFLVDENLSPLVAKLLSGAGHDAVHTSEIDMRRASDPEVLDRAEREGRTILSADTDFGTLLSRRGTAGPSVILLRRSQDRRAAAVADLVLANLAPVEAALAEGAIVVLEERRLRVRALPLR